MAPPQTRFNLKWLDPVLYPDFVGWLQKVQDDDTRAYCKTCAKQFSLSNMGRRAVVMHASGSGHKSVMIIKASQAYSMHNYLLQNTAASLEVPVDNTPEREDHHKSYLEKPSSLGKAVDMLQYTYKDEDVTTAEIMWVLNVIEKKNTLNSCTNITQIFKLMFPDSAVAKQFQLGSDKVSYIIQFGLSHYFSDVLLSNIHKCQNICIIFDESLNKIVQRGQMDLLIRFWDETKNVVATRYLTSVFLGHSTANDLLKKFLEGLSGFNLSKIIQISMDGPNVNHSFLKKFEEHMETFPTVEKLLHLGTCGLHTVHGSVKAGLKAVDWNLFGILRNMYYLLKDSPSRRADYTRITGSTKFPKNFGATRWLENTECLDRAIEIGDCIKTFVNTCALKNSKVTDSLKKAFQDPLLMCKMTFFRSLCEACERFLKRFQSPKPMVPYLYDELYHLLNCLLKRYIKAEKLTKKNILTGDITDNPDNLLQARKIAVGFGTQKLLKNIKASDKEKFSFFMDCQKVLIAMSKKLLYRSPLKFPIVQALKSLAPSVVSQSDSAVAQEHFAKVLEVMHEVGRIPEKTADRANQQYEELCSAAKDSSKLRGDFDSFLSERNDKVGLDTFYNSILDTKVEYAELWSVIKICLTLSHGNASVEAGFSINKSMLVENLLEDSLVNQRKVYDAIKYHGGIHNIDINKKMILAVRAARQRYRGHLEHKRKSDMEQETRSQEKRKLQNEVRDLHKKMKALKEDHEKEERKIELRIEVLKEKNKSLHN